MGKNVLREILQDIREAKCFSLLADEATDMSNAEQLCINIQWVDYELNIYEAPLELIHVPKTDSSTITTLRGWVHMSEWLSLSYFFTLSTAQKKQTHTIQLR